MTDHLSKKRRSWNMSQIRSSGTKPEKIVRSALHRRGYRFRIDVEGLPGRPDIVLPKHRKIIFVHGCFWHRHPGCRRCTTPTTNQVYWLEKFRNNIDRDKKVTKELEELGWEVLKIWECETKNRELNKIIDTSFMTDSDR